MQVLTLSPAEALHAIVLTLKLGLDDKIAQVSMAQSDAAHEHMDSQTNRHHTSRCIIRDDALLSVPQVFMSSLALLETMLGACDRAGLKRPQVWMTTRTSMLDAGRLTLAFYCAALCMF